MQYRLKKFSFISAAIDAGGIGPALNWFRGTPYLDMTAAQFRQLAGANLGEGFETDGPPSSGGGNTYVFFKAKAALAEGQVIAMEAPTTGTVTNNAAQSTVNSVLTNINNAATVAINGDVDNFFYFTSSSSGLCQMRRIKANTSSATARYDVALRNNLLPNTPFDQDGFDAMVVGDNGAVCSIIRPYNAIVNTATTVPIGIALGTVTSGNYTIALVKGLAFVQAVGNVQALVVNEPAAGAAGGVISGFRVTAAGPLALSSPVANLWSGASSIVPMVATAANPGAAPGNGNVLIPCMVNFLGQ